MSNSDPRIAPLAAALANALTYNDHHPYDLDPIGSAAAILAALDGWTLVCDVDPLPIGEPAMHRHDGLGAHRAETHHRPEDYR